MDDIVSAGGEFPPEIRPQIHKRGCVIVRNTIDKIEAWKILDEIKDYMTKNGEDPEDVDKTFYEIYWSKPQVRK